MEGHFAERRKRRKQGGTKSAFNYANHFTEYGTFSSTVRGGPSLSGREQGPVPRECEVRGATVDVGHGTMNGTPAAFRVRRRAAPSGAHEPEPELQPQQCGALLGDLVASQPVRGSAARLVRLGAAPVTWGDLAAFEEEAHDSSCWYTLELAAATDSCRNPGKSRPEQQWRQREERACLHHSPSPGWPTKPSAPTDTSRCSILNSFTRWRCPRRGLPSAILSKAILKVAIPAGAQDADLRDEAHTKEGEEGQGYGREGGCTTGQPCYSRCR